ncbi:MAG: choice-of-anchor R domain-containing protein [Solirubrobacterales bacterium]
MFRTSLQFLIALSLGPAALAVPVVEDIVLANFAALADYDDGSSFQVGTVSGQNRVFGQGFTSGTGPHRQLTAVELGLSDPDTSATIRVRLFTSTTSGTLTVPGTALETFNLSNGPVNSLGTYRFVAQSGTYTIDPATSYWLVVEDTAGSPSQFNWAQNDAGASPTSGPYGYSYIGPRRSTDGGVNWANGPNGSNALTMQILAVPEPSTVCLAESDW